MSSAPSRPRSGSGTVFEVPHKIGAFSGTQTDSTCFGRSTKGPSSVGTHPLVPQTPPLGHPSECLPSVRTTSADSYPTRHALCLPADLRLPRVVGEILHLNPL